MPGRLGENIVHFARVVRATIVPAGPAGPDSVVTTFGALGHAALSVVLIAS